MGPKRKTPIHGPPPPPTHRAHTNARVLNLMFMRRILFVAGPKNIQRCYYRWNTYSLISLMRPICWFFDFSTSQLLCEWALVWACASRRHGCRCVCVCEPICASKRVFCSMCLAVLLLFIVAIASTNIEAQNRQDSRARRRSTHTITQAHTGRMGMQYRIAPMIEWHSTIHGGVRIPPSLPPVIAVRRDRPIVHVLYPHSDLVGRPQTTSQNRMKHIAHMQNKFISVRIIFCLAFSMNHRVAERTTFTRTKHTIFFYLVGLHY